MYNGVCVELSALLPSLLVGFTWRLDLIRQVCAASALPTMPSLRSYGFIILCLLYKILQGKKGDTNEALGTQSGN